MIAEINKDTFDQEVLKHNGKVLVDFFSPTCGPCMVLMRTIENYQTDAKIVKVDVYKNPELAEEYGVKSIPYLVLFCDGQKVAERAGKTSSKDLTTLMESV